MTMNHENLEKLASYLENLPEDYQHFGMQTYVTPTDMAALKKYAENNGGVHTCGTSACALGHGPAAGILFPDDDKFWERTQSAYLFDEKGTPQWVDGPFRLPNWDAYCFEFFLPEDNNHELWSWCFGPSWSRIDDTPKGAAARIRYFLAKDVPHDFSKPEDRYQTMANNYLKGA